MNALVPLMQREWLQHRLGWIVAGSLPFALALLVVGFAPIRIGNQPIDETPLPTALALGSMAGSLMISLAVLWVTSLILVSGLSRRDHSDRSIEFWLSMPVGHGQSLAVPLLVHLILVPLAALLIGLAGGALVSLVLVGRVAGLADWLQLPWLALLPGVLAMTARLALGVVLATFWLLPIILAVVLLTAWFRRWGLVILAAGIGLGSAIMDRVLGQPLLWDVLSGLFERAGRSVINAGGGDPGLVIDKPADVESALGMIPGWAAHDAWLALGWLASPWFIGALGVSALLFWLLVQWRRTGASAGG